MRWKMIIAVALLAALHAARAVVCSGAQPETSAGQADFSDMVHVNVVNVEIFVTDPEGNPVTGLTADDFELFENTTPMEITNFYAVERGRRTAAPSAGPRPAPQMPAPPAPEPAPQADESLRLLVYVDNFNLHPGDRKRMVGQLSELLGRTLGPEDRVMLAAFDRALHVRQPLTSDPQRVVEALRELAETPTAGARHDGERRRLLMEIDRTTDQRKLLFAIRAFANEVRHDVSVSIEGLRGAVEMLAGLPGRKAVLYVSSGIPMIAAGDLFLAVQDKIPLAIVHPELREFDTSSRFGELVELANAHEVTFYTLDAGGLRSSVIGSAAEEGHLREARVAMHIDANYEANLQEPLQVLAQHTGGQAILHRNEVLPALEKAVHDFRSFYSLGYSPPHYGDGNSYTLAVKVKREGLRVRHRESYRDKSLETRIGERMRATLRHSTTSNPLGLELVVDPASAHGEKRFLVPIQVRVPVEKLVLLEQEGEYLGRVRLFVAVMDERGAMSRVQDTPLAVRIPRAVVEAGGEPWLHTHRLRMRSGQHQVGVGVLDEWGGVEAFVSRSVQVGGSGEERPGSLR